MEALLVITLGEKPWGCVDASQIMAVCGCCPFSQALMEALQVITFGAESSGCGDASVLMAVCGCCPIRKRW